MALLENKNIGTPRPHLRKVASAYAFLTNPRAVLNSANWRAWSTDYKYHIFEGGLRSNKVTRGHQTFEKSAKRPIFSIPNTSYLITQATNQIEAYGLTNLCKVKTFGLRSLAVIWGHRGRNSNIFKTGQIIYQNEALGLAINKKCFFFGVIRGHTTPNSGYLGSSGGQNQVSASGSGGVGSGLSPIFRSGSGSARC